ncbi:helix-turn-helix domain-containing protein [Arthrobacter sp. Marseille-P9274]|uniref:helix-turn-helix domain-containing protein n=1 Tax=Arthrobacter sp. Marseille-P9274 TaxID=2866572 RepID=UPI0021C6CFAA|nr:helix-turn-helix domain-containing protein [Arthrobacter sp. Marseille-P9274]
MPADGPDDQACRAVQLPVIKSTSTHHFRVLHEASLIEQHYRGTSILNTLRADELEARFPGLLQSVLQAYRREAPSPTAERLQPAAGLPATC